MKAPLASHRSSASANLTPMIDVVFLLIIFFLVSSHLAKRELHQPLDLPRAASYETSLSTDVRLTFNVAADGGLTVGAHRIPQDQIASVLHQRQADSKSPPAVRIRMDKVVTYDRIEPLLRELAVAGVVDIAFAVEDGKKP